MAIMTPAGAARSATRSRCSTVAKPGRRARAAGALGAILLLGAGTATSSGDEVGTGSEPVYATALGIGLESVPYPYPVGFVASVVDGQPLRMAYMNVAPSGPPNDRTVVLLHGKNFYGSYWAGTIAALSAAGYRVVVPDQIGFGKSSKPDVHYSFDLLARNTLRLLDHLEVARAAVVGHSMGGMLAVRLARTAPERFTHLVLENPIGLEDYREKVPPAETGHLFRVEMNQTTGGYRAFIRRYVVRWDPAVYEPFVEVRSRVMLSGEYPRWAQASALTYQMIYREPVRHEFGLIRTPTLLVIGQDDRTTLGRGLVSPDVLATLGQYPALGRAAARDIPGSQLVELDGVGHIPHLEAPDRFHEALLRFLSA